jgi:hypothetical protein
MVHEIIFNGQMLFFHLDSVLIGIGMIFVALGFFAQSRRRGLDSKAYWWGGLVWFFGVAAKILCARLAVPPVIAFLNSSQSVGFAKFAEWIYVGSFTGVFECIPIYFVLKKKFRNRKIAVHKSFGVGFGSAEAFVVGLGITIFFGLYPYYLGLAYKPCHWNRPYSVVLVWLYF